MGCGNEIPPSLQPLIMPEGELVGDVDILSVLYLWTAPAWLAWYLIATVITKARTEDIRDNTVIAD
jgi:hypothetical protein